MRQLGQSYKLSNQNKSNAAPTLKGGVNNSRTLGKYILKNKWLAKLTKKCPPRKSPNPLLPFTTGSLLTHFTCFQKS